MANYWIIKAAVSKEQCALIAKYALLKTRVHNRGRKGGALSGVHREYGDALMEVLLSELQPLVEAKVGVSLWPTLSFYYTYQHQQSLEKHQDRSSCEWVAGLCIGMDEAYHLAHETWPMFLQLPDETVSIDLQPGDLVIFKGHEIPHWREAFLGEWFISAIFSYVEQEGPLAFQRFDQRRQLGEPHIGMFAWTYGVVKNYLRRKYAHGTRKI